MPTVQDSKGRLGDGKIFGTFLDNDANPSLENADAAILGVAFDATASYAKGMRLGPHAIMAASHQIEYPPPGSTDRLSDRVKMHFVGILEYPRAEKDADASSRAMVADVQQLSKEILEKGKLLAVFGGEHSVLNGVFKTLAEIYKPSDVTVLQIDAHLDLRKAFEGMEFSHGSIMRNCAELGFRTVHVGIRDQISGKPDTGGEADYILEKGLAERIFFCATQPHEFYSGRMKNAERNWILKDNLIFNGVLEGKIIGKIERLVQETKHLWLTIDVDGFDSSVFPGTGTPLPHGLQLAGVERLLYRILKGKKPKLLGFDIAEVMPQMCSKVNNYSVDDAVSTITEMNAALLAYKIFFWNFLDRF